MKMNTLVVTGSSGLIGSEMVEYFDRLGWQPEGYVFFNYVVKANKRRRMLRHA